MQLRNTRKLCLSGSGINLNSSKFCGLHKKKKGSPVDKTPTNAGSEKELDHMKSIIYSLTPYIAKGCFHNLNL